MMMPVAVDGYMAHDHSISCPVPPPLTVCLCFIAHEDQRNSDLVFRHLQVVVHAQRYDEDTVREKKAIRESIRW